MANNAGPGNINRSTCVNKEKSRDVEQQIGGEGSLRIGQSPQKAIKTMMSNKYKKHHDFSIL